MIWLAPLIKNRWAIFLIVAILASGGAWLHGYFKGKQTEQLRAAKKQIVLISEAQRDRERIDDEVNKISDVDTVLIRNGWLRPDDEL